MTKQLHTPIALCVFNRPDLTSQVLAAIRNAQPRRLYVIADGARASVAGERDRVDAVRRCVESGVTWPCELRRIFSSINLGCARRVASGLHEVFAEEESAIILEDDCVPDPTFFRFCDELLSRYAADMRVGAISGDNFQKSGWSCPSSYYFSRYPHCWGWATWRRAWANYDHAMADWPKLRRGNWLRERVSDRLEYSYWRDAFDETIAGGNDSWAYRWTYSCWRVGVCSVLPARNLVSNIGFGDSATHTTGRSEFAGMATWPMRFPLVHPAQVQVDISADAATARRNYRKASLWARTVRKLASRWRQQ